jgi:hypothetical protein
VTTEGPDDMSRLIGSGDCLPVPSIPVLYILSNAFKH